MPTIIIPMGTSGFAKSPSYWEERNAGEWSNQAKGHFHGHAAASWNYEWVLDPNCWLTAPDALSTDDTTSYARCDNNGFRDDWVAAPFPMGPGDATDRIYMTVYGQQDYGYWIPDTGVTITNAKAIFVLRCEKAGKVDININHWQWQPVGGYWEGSRTNGVGATMDYLTPNAWQRYELALTSANIFKSYLADNMYYMSAGPRNDNAIVDPPDPPMLDVAYLGLQFDVSKISYRTNANLVSTGAFGSAGRGVQGGPREARRTFINSF